MILFEFDTYKDIKPEVPTSFKIDDFKSYLSTVWKNRKAFAEYDEPEIYSESELSEIRRNKQGFLKFDGSKISARNYVGFIQYEGFQVNIYPKVFKKDGIPTNNECNFYLNRVLYWLSYCSKIRFPFSEVNFNYQDCDNFLEAFIYLFSHYTEKVITENPYQCYQEVTEETNFLRGRLELSEYFNKNISTGNLQNFQCTYEPFVFDNLFNQIVKYTTKILLEVSNSRANKDKLQSILFVLDDVSDKLCIAEECDKVKFNKLFEELDIVLSMCRMFLANQTINIDHNDNLNFCFLVPMEYVFEDFIYGFIRKHFPETKPQSQKSNQYLTKERVFNLQHDIYLKEPKTIIDTKYKIRKYEPNDKKAGISQADMYQMVSYAIRQNCNNIILIYPQKYRINNPDEKHFTIESKMFSNNEEIKIRALNISITNPEESILKKEIEEVIYS